MMMMLSSLLSLHVLQLFNNWSQLFYSFWGAKRKEDGMKVALLPDKTVIRSRESRREAAHSSVASAIKSTVGDGWGAPELPNNGVGSWIPEPPNNGEGLQIEADLPDDASTDFEEDDWWLIAERISFGDMNVGFMVMGSHQN
jgi:hypothetical protein